MVNDKFCICICFSAFTQFAESNNKLFTSKKIKLERWDVLSYIIINRFTINDLLTHKHRLDGIHNLCLVVHRFQHTAFNLASTYNLYMALYFHNDSNGSSSAECRVPSGLKRNGAKKKLWTENKKNRAHWKKNWMKQNTSSNGSWQRRFIMKNSICSNAVDTAVNVIVDSAHGRVCTESSRMTLVNIERVHWKLVVVGGGGGGVGGWSRNMEHVKEIEPYNLTWDDSTMLFVLSHKPWI